MIHKNPKIANTQYPAEKASESFFSSSIDNLMSAGNDKDSGSDEIQ
jgi:hypothetical protein